jgi:integrase
MNDHDELDPDEVARRIEAVREAKLDIKRGTRDGRDRLLRGELDRALEPGGYRPVNRLKAKDPKPAPAPPKPAPPKPRPRPRPEPPPAPLPDPEVQAILKLKHSPLGYDGLRRVHAWLGLFLEDLARC